MGCAALTDKLAVLNSDYIVAPDQPLFQARTIDSDPRLLDQSYQVRYQVYCLERQFLNANDYPNERERDEFDDYSVHVGAVDRSGDVAGTARLVYPSRLGLPLLHHCELYPHETVLTDPANNVVEVSRLSISRRYTRRKGDDSIGPPQILEGEDPISVPRERRRANNLLFVTLLKAIYQAAKRLRASHWVVATEPSLQRRIVQFGLPFHQAGPPAEYYGVVAAYAMSLRDFDQVILGRQIDSLDDFLIGLEPEFSPAAPSVQPMRTPSVTAGGDTAPLRFCAELRV
jgi:N-acyl amino acid synthase of PEP-CTERM/exosortase system